MKANRMSMWAVAAVMAAMLAVGSAGRAEAGLSGPRQLPVEDLVKRVGGGINHQVSDGLAAARRVALTAIRPLLRMLPEDWEWQQPPVHQPIAD
jgi:hypothetical protein